LVVAFGSAIFTTAFAGERLANLTLGVEEIVDGSTTHPISISGNDEINLLAKAFNGLDAKLRALQAKQIREDELIAAKRFTDNVIRSMFDVLIVTDPDLRIITVNKAACELLEYSEMDLLERPMETLFKQQSMMINA